MDPVNWEIKPTLTSPLLLVAFEGWFDAGSCATGALTWLRDSAEEVERFAEIDLERFLDFQETRPIVRNGPNDNRVIEWPSVDCYAVKDNMRHDFVVMQGVEPRMRWRTFTEAVLQVATDTKCQMIVTMGSTAAGVAHSRPHTVKSSAGNASLAKRMGLAAPTYQGPTGVIGTLHDMADKADIPVISLRVGVPHYVAGPPNPKGTQALLEQFQYLIGVPTHYEELDTEVAHWESRVNEATESDPEVMAYIVQLEKESDRIAEENLPSGDDLASQIEQFLSEQDSDSQDPGSPNLGPDSPAQDPKPPTDGR